MRYRLLVVCTDTVTSGAYATSLTKLDPTTSTRMEMNR